LKNISNNFNEIIITKTLASQQNYIKKPTNTEFSSLINNEVKEIDDSTEVQEDSSKYKIIQQLELENLSYLNKIFLSITI